MTAFDPKALAQERFENPDRLVEGIDIIGRFATDPLLIVRGLLEAVRERVPAGGCVAELGFGSGWLLEELRTQMTDVSLLGLDLSPGNVKRSRDLYGDRAGLVIGDMEELPFTDASFDVIVTCWTLYFMRDIDVALQGIRRCLKPRGRLVVGASAPDHEIEAEELVRRAAGEALGRTPVEGDIGGRFDLETGAKYLNRHFASVEIRRWPGEMVLPDLRDVMALWPKWQPAALDAEDLERVRTAFERLASERLEREGSLPTRRRDGAFICDLK